MVENQQISLNWTQVVGVMLNGQPVPALVLKSKDGSCNTFLSEQGLFDDREVPVQLIFPNYEEEFLPINVKPLEIVQMRLKGMH